MKTIKILSKHYRIGNMTKYEKQCVSNKLENIRFIKSKLEIDPLRNGATSKEIEK